MIRDEINNAIFESLKIEIPKLGYEIFIFEGDNWAAICVDKVKIAFNEHYILNRTVEIDFKNNNVILLFLKKKKEGEPGYNYTEQRIVMGPPEDPKFDPQSIIAQILTIIKDRMNLDD
jgi:hypothetical protein